MTARTIAARTPHVGSFFTALTLAAMLATMAGATSAEAWDQQATGEQMTYELSHRVLDGGTAAHRDLGAYASANPQPRGVIHRRSPEASFGTSVPYDADGPAANDFQLQGK